jgi:hypothetical protein
MCVSVYVSALILFLLLKDPRPHMGLRPVLEPSRSGLHFGEAEYNTKGAVFHGHCWDISACL